MKCVGLYRLQYFGDKDGRKAREKLVSEIHKVRVEAYDFSSRSLPNRLDDFIGHAIDSHAEFLKKRFAFRIEILKAKYVRIGKSGHNDRCGNPLFQRDALGKAFDRRFRGALGGNARKRTQRRRASYVDNLGPYTLF